MIQLLVELRDGAPISEQVSEIRQALDTGRYRSLLIHIYSGVTGEVRLTQVAKALHACFREAVIVGTMSAGEIMNGRLMAQGILVSALLFEETEIRLMRFGGVKGHEAEIGRRICEALDAVPALKGVELLFPGTAMDTRTLYAELGRCRKDIGIFGGYTGGHQLNSPEHFVFDAFDVYYDAMLVVTYAGERLHIDMDKTIGWEGLGMPFKVTRADGNHLIELDGKPAAEVYEKFLQIDRKQHNNAEDAFEFPLIANQGGDEWLRSIVHIEEDGSMFLHGFVTEGMDIHLSYGNPSNIVEKVNHRLEALCRFRPQVILLYSCVVRKAFWEDFVNMEMEPFQQIAPTSGFHTWGEVMRNPATGAVDENNITMLSIAMREGDAPADGPADIRVDDTILRGQASLLKRLTRLVYTTMEELQKAHSSLSVLNRKLTVMAEHDALTGLYNRGKMSQLINDALDDSVRTGREVSMVMVDVDHFKHVNDTYGHDAGDAVLSELARLLEGTASEVPGARTGRWGGEEFFILLPDTVRAAALAFAEALRVRVAEFAFTGAGRLTISQGVITALGGEDRKGLYTRVDDALYQAKTSGRNCVVQCD